MKSILVFTTALSQGGITSFLIPLCNTLYDLGNQVTLAYSDDTGDYLARLHPEIKAVKYDVLSRKSIILSWLKNFAFYDMARLFFRRRKQKPHYPSVQRLNYIIANSTPFPTEKYDVAISTAEGFCNAMVATKINSPKKIGWVHPNMAAIGLDTKAGQRVLDKLSIVVSVSEAGCEALQSFFPKDKSKFIYIENMLDSERIRRQSELPIYDMPIIDPNMNIVTVCRITNESKRLDRVIRIASILKNRAAKFRWYIIGDGPDFNYIKSLIEKFDLIEEVIMLGGRNNPMPYIKNADCFVLTSQFEGKPVVVEEAKILHTPVIVTNYSSAKKQVTAEVGIVVPNQDGMLEEAIANILLDEKVISGLQRSSLTYEYDNTESIEKISALLQ